MHRLMEIPHQVDNPADGLTLREFRIGSRRLQDGDAAPQRMYDVVRRDEGFEGVAGRWVGGGVGGSPERQIDEVP